MLLLETPLTHSAPLASTTSRQRTRVIPSVCADPRGALSDNLMQHATASCRCRVLARIKQLGLGRLQVRSSVKDLALSCDFLGSVARVESGPSTALTTLR